MDWGKPRKACQESLPSGQEWNLVPTKYEEVQATQPLHLITEHKDLYLMCQKMQEIKTQ
jgi:hypothetical protein